jgi:hypothetical protein
MNDIVLGYGVFSIGAVDIGLTRGGGAFNVEREMREIPADGDYGPVKGRISLDREVATLTVNALQLLPANLPKLYPATTNTNAAGPPVSDTIKSTLKVADGDYNTTVKWTGKTKGGRSVIITLENAINLEGIDWSLVDKDEVVPEVTFTATYLDSARETAPWDIKYVDAV